MQKLTTPFNVNLLSPTPEQLRGVKQVSALDPFDGATNNFHPRGLFSTEIFGRVGDEKRSLLYGYIDIKAPIFHPLVFMTLVKLKRLYGEIMSGKAMALWDENKKDFVAGKPNEGARTGYAFFLEHWAEIDFGETNSSIRRNYIELIQKGKDKAMSRYVVVMPAGLRDMEIDEFNRKSEDEINKLYRSLIATSNIIVESSLITNPDVIDKPRYDMQLKFCSIYDHIESLIRGKKKLFLGKVATRRIFNGTRNVITAMNTSVPVLGKKGAPGFNSTIIGLYQYLQATQIVSATQVRNFLAEYFPDINSPARLVDRKTLKPRDVFLHARYYDRWATTEGTEKVLASYKEEAIRNLPIIIDGYYLALVYTGPDGTFKVFSDIDELPPSRMPEHVRPMTLTDLLYLSVYRHFDKYPCFVTRYPVTGVGSIYPSRTHLRVTVDFEERRMLGDDWVDAGEEYTAHEFPVIGSAFVNSLIPHTSHLGRLNADFDGDTASANIAYSDEAIREKENFFKKRKAYIGTDGKFLFSCAVATVELVLHNMTGEPAVEIANEAYQEEDDSLFSHWGVKYNLNKVLELCEDIPPEKVDMSELKWCVDKNLDKKRVAAADTSHPLIALREDGIVYVCDGNHRLVKLFNEGATSAMVIFIDHDILKKARVK